MNKVFKDVLASRPMVGSKKGPPTKPAYKGKAVREEVPERVKPIAVVLPSSIWSSVAPVSEPPKKEEKKSKRTSD